MRQLRTMERALAQRLDARRKTVLLSLLCLLLPLAVPGCALPQPKALVDFSQCKHPADSLVGSFVWLDLAEWDNRLFRLHLETGELSSRTVSSKMVAFSRTTKDGDFAMLRKSGGPFHRKLIVEVANWNDGDAEARIVADLEAARFQSASVAISADGALVAATMTLLHQNVGELWVWNSEHQLVARRTVQASPHLLFDAQDPVLYWDDTAESADVPEVQDMVRKDAGLDLRIHRDGSVAVVYATDFRSGSTEALHSTYSFVPRAGEGFLARVRDGWATFDANGAFLESFGPSKQAWVHYCAAYGATGPDTLLVGTLAPPERRTSRRPFLMGPDHLWEVSLADVRTGALVPLMTNVDHSNRLIWSPH